MIRKFDETEQYDTSMKIIFATNNAHKLSEVQAVLGPDFELVTPRSVGITEEIPEQQDTIAGNASQKARYVHDRTGCDCFADDTGLEVEALGGAPGVHSARYATDGHDFAANNELLLRNLEGVGNRRARFRTVISLILDGEEHLFEGIVEGTSPSALRAPKASATTRSSFPKGVPRPTQKWTRQRKTLSRTGAAPCVN